MTLVDKAHEAIQALKDHTFDLICLDHDLGGQVMVDSSREDTGAEVARYILE